VPADPSSAGLAGLRAAAAGCRACPLHLTGTQTVFGEGKPSAPLVLVGEQPGNAEDLAGRPFVGPAGALLDRALEEAGIARSDAYVTNAVKHFSWVPKGKLRIHKKPTGSEVAACLPWLEAEIALLRPRVIVALGATATRVLLGPSARVLRDRGKPMPSPRGALVFATVHPSSVLRAPSDEDRRADYAALVRDLRVVARALVTPARGTRAGRAAARRRTPRTRARRAPRRSGA
jgi:uracil-DNA glycosylase